MKNQTHRLDFQVTAERERLALMRDDAGCVTCARAHDILTRSFRTIGDVAYKLLIITIVVTHPILVMCLMVHG